MRLLKAIVLGLLIAGVGISSYFLLDGFDMEESTGLDILFKQRGQRPAPEEVLLVAMDKFASDKLGLPNDPTKWPRDLHARLIDRLSAAGAAVIVLDVFFKESRDKQQDTALADAIRSAGNVILFSHLQREILSMQGKTPERVQDQALLNIERLVHPTSVIAQAPVALAPFALLKYPLKVTKFWTFRVPAGEIPNIPAMALQLYAMDVYPALLQLLQQLSPNDSQHLPTNPNVVLNTQGLAKLVSELHTLFRIKPELGTDLLNALQQPAANGLALIPSQQKRLEALIKMYQGGNQHYLNFYGPPRTIHTITYDKFLDETVSLDVKGKIIFVGFSERLQPEQKDNFYTVFSQPDGLDLSGVEIAATAFANLLHAETIKPLPPAAFITLIFCYGIIIALLGRLPPTTIAIAISLLFAGFYAFMSVSLFKSNNLWLPLIVPLAIQTPLALFVALLWGYLETNSERKRIRQAFGYYLPNNVVDQLAHKTSKIHANHQRMYGICLATDAEQYTALAETMTPEDLGELMNSYYEILFKPVRNRDGIISDVVGDAMLALWSSVQADAQLKFKACDAALDIIKAVAQFNPSAKQSTTPILPTRIGLHAGQILLGNVGAIDHYEYRAVGDIVNTANRIQGMNKQMGTRIIASKETLHDVNGFLSRELGQFRLVGKQQAITLFELLCRKEAATPLQVDLCERFSAALDMYQKRDLDNAVGKFLQILADFPTDGPSQFYINLCRNHIGRNSIAGPPQGSWDGVIVMDQK